MHGLFSLPISTQLNQLAHQEELEVPKTTAKSRTQVIGPPTGRRVSVRLSGRTSVEFDDDQKSKPDDLEEELLDTSDDEGPATKSNVKVPLIDKDGLTRIGPQPKQPAVYRMPTSSRLHEAEMEATEQKLVHVQSLVAYGPNNNKITRHCAYTGNQLSWPPGPPSISVKAIYPYIASDQQPAYHTAQNVTTISSSLNWTKGKSAPILLPLLATWLNAYYAPGLGFKQVLELFQTGWKTSDVANVIGSYDTGDLYYIQRKSE
ncbi:hypothetical protein V8C34DRAFT_318727 [Trichoderma compactum]